MYRKAEHRLQKWKASQKKKALLITGPRQVGKTYIVREFGKANYKHFVEINFITTPTAADIFSGDLNADTIIMNLTAFIGRPLENGKTLIFLDEIQECPNARTAIKFLVDDGSTDDSNIPIKVNGLPTIVKVDAYKYTSAFLSKS